MEHTADSAYKIHSQPLPPETPNSTILKQAPPKTHDFLYKTSGPIHKVYETHDNNAHSRKEIPTFDPIVSLPQSKLLNLIDALVSTAAALRESLPGQITDRELEEGRRKEEEDRKTEDQMRIPILTAKQDLGNSVHSMEILDIEHVIQTEPEHLDVLADEAVEDIETFCEAYPESGLHDPAGPVNMRSSHAPASQKALDSRILQAIFGPRRKGITSNMWALDKYSWEACMRPYLVLLKDRLEQRWPLSGRNPSLNGIRSSNDDEAVRMCNILVAICRTTIDNAPIHERRNFGTLTLGRCLRECYRQQLLIPVAEDIPSQAEMIVKAFGLIDIVSKRSNTMSSIIVSQMSPESLLNTTISSILCKGRKTFETHLQILQEKPSNTTNDANKDMSQTLRDLNIRILTSIGALKIVWTSNISDHLKLYLAPNDNRLKVYWFGHTAQQLPIYGLYNCACPKHPNLDEMLKELRLTYEFLFGAYDDVADAKKTRKVYSRTKAPPWLIDLRPGESNGGYFFNRWFTREKILSDFVDVDNIDLNSDVGLHLCNASLNSFYTSRINAQLTERDFCGHFPTFKQRIYLLERYMLQQRAKTLKDLWRDRRDKLSWYTFWAVIIIGGFGLILTIASLGISTAQTVAAFQALNLPSNRGTSPI